MFLSLLAWISFVGVSIEAGGLLVNFVVSLIKPEIVENLYQKLNLLDLYTDQKILFFGIYGFILPLAFLKSVFFYRVITLLQKLKMSNPFISHLTSQIAGMAYFSLVVGAITYLAGQIAESMLVQDFVREQLQAFWSDSGAYILMGGLIYITAISLKKGVRIQNEDDLIS